MYKLNSEFSLSHLDADCWSDFLAGVHFLAFFSTIVQAVEQHSSPVIVSICSQISLLLNCNYVRLLWILWIRQT